MVNLGAPTSGMLALAAPEDVGGSARTTRIKACSPPCSSHFHGLIAAIPRSISR